MKKVEFGYSNDVNCKGVWEGMGIKPGLLLSEAEYYGAIKYGGESYMVTKVTEDKYGRFPTLLGKFIVRPVTADIYPDGGGFVFLDQEESQITQQLEAHLNAQQNRDRISNIADVLNRCRGFSMADIDFEDFALGDELITTSIPHEAFESKKQQQKSGRRSY